ncbi:hypothetical protein DFJ58DRAFT_766025 [Suillus subalutaceus]|uniref:uncharacterized protein n=1 Tax=Suillus subalutaceus TaxID=48586 RepID=UPI001B864C47|nr:uncharacterized protein DFJ58DRAFT_766025 [Suillus subalutaceus]KAG1869416.1 hypothetical protein DFJ58DRAFT_766025 [Suillus subalutaceus]
MIRRIVVMDGTTAYSTPKLPSNLHGQLTTAIEYCHKQGYILSEHQKPNIMITKDDKVYLIDCDWDGREGEATYPLAESISAGINWPTEVQAQGLIGLRP